VKVGGKYVAGAAGEQRRLKEHPRRLARGSSLSWCSW
jgi:hypothetical protein